MMNVQAVVKAYLASKHITVPEEWITACVEWIQSENAGVNINNSRVVSEKVYEQWLYCDLTELAACCLPFGLQQKRSTYITGHFALQVNQIRDVGQSAYSQLQKVQRVDTVNAAISAEQTHQPAWEPKPSRMLMLQMTDGTSVVQGMEYRLIPSLNANLKPGLKVMISGTICARRGVLLLTQEHITILGGEIEALLIPNALENVLARHLGAEENEQPRDYEETTSTQVAPSQTSQYYPSQLNSAPSRSQNSRPPRRGGTQVSSGNRGQTGVSVHSTSDFDDLGDDDFLDSDIEAVLSQIENQAMRVSSNTSTVHPAGNSRNVNYRTINESSSKSLNPTNTVSVSHNNLILEDGGMDDEMNVDSSFFTDDFDDEILLSAEGQINESSSCSETSTIATPQSTRKSAQTLSESSKQSSSFSNLPATLQSKALTSIRQAKSSCIRTSMPNITNVQPLANKLSKLNQPVALKKNNKLQSKQLNLKSFFSQQSSQSSRNNSSLDSKKFKQNVKNKDDIQQDFLSECEGTLHSESLDMEAPGAVGARPSDLKLTVTQMSKQEPPFTYMIFIPTKPTVAQEFIVKGFIMTLVSRLEQLAGLWKLTVMINDGTASCEVDIDDHVLQELIGLSVEEMNLKKIEAKSNPVLKSQLAKSVGGCQQKLISLCSLLHLQVSPHYTKPRLTAISSVTTSVAQQLAKRLSLTTSS
ncbi:recQ-mediated genome instability protein 1 [Procambarus clarkii]|uniref:recQ-mediated genome instability protein 1 n=1 Tax=Procambarus clarkii TaxID=6728 RepID=UPI00374246B7